MNSWKPAIFSKGIIGAIIAIIGAGLPLLGYALTDDDRAALQDVIESGLLVAGNLIAVGGAMLALWGRISAKRQISGVVTAATPPPRTEAQVTRDLNLDEARRHHRGNL
jgi:hypothetical protein